MTIVECRKPTGEKRGLIVYATHIRPRVHIESINDPKATTEHTYGTLQLTIDQAKELRKALDNAIGELERWS